MSITGKCQKQAGRRDEANLSRAALSGRTGQRTDKGARTLAIGENGSAIEHNKKKSWTSRYADGGNLIQDGSSPKPAGFISHIHLGRSPFGKIVSVEMMWSWNVSKFELERLDESFTGSVLPVSKTSWPKTCLESNESKISTHVIFFLFFICENLTPSKLPHWSHNHSSPGSIWSLSIC